MDWWKSPAIHPVVMVLPDTCGGLRGAEKLEKLGAASREALHCSAVFSGVDFSSPLKNENGVPVAVNGLYWSVTHAAPYAAAVVAPYPVGIDLEPIMPVSQVLRDRVAVKEEWALAPSFTPELFFRYWTAKEAVLKATGDGLTGLENCKISSVDTDHCLRIHYLEKFWDVCHYEGRNQEKKEGPDYIAAVTKRSHTPIWHHLATGDECVL